MRKQLLPWFSALCLTSVHVVSLAQAPTWAAASLKKASVRVDRAPAQQEDTVKSMLRQIQEKYKINLLYDDRLVEGRNSTYRLSAGLTENVESVLEKVLKPAGLTYVKISNRTYSIVSPQKTESEYNQYADTNTYTHLSESTQAEKPVGHTAE